jgi:hypothetical protein
MLVTRYMNHHDLFDSRTGEEEFFPVAGGLFVLLLAHHIVTRVMPVYNISDSWMRFLRSPYYYYFVNPRSCTPCRRQQLYLLL